MKQPKTRTKTILFLTVLCLIAGLALSACKVVNTYKVIFLSDDAVYATVEVKEGETINLPTDPTKEGYTFGGWVYSNDPSLTFDGSGKITASIKVTAKWILNEDPNDPTDSDEIFYTVTYVLNGGIGDYTDGEVKEGTEISALTDPTKEGYEFDGWYTTESLTGSAVAFPYTVNADTTFYAKWVEISDEYTEGLLFTPITGGYKVSVGTTENETEIVIPRTYNGEPVLEIDNSFIVCTKLVKLTVPFVGATLDGTSNVHFGYIFGASSYSEYSKVPASLREVIVTGEVSIGNLAFSRCSGLTSITLPNVTSIGYMAFYNCSGLTTITIPNVTSIGEEAFWYCSGLTTITIPKVTSIGNRAFYYCSKLTEISVPNVTSIGSSAFYYCSGLTEISVPNVTSIGAGTFAYCRGLTTILLPNVTSIDDNAFRECSGLTTITIHSNITYIGSYVFQDCSKLTIYVEASSQPSGWNASWNSSSRPVVWGCTLSEDGSYVVSFTKTASSISNPTATNGISAPYREGYTFGGWATVEGGTAAYTAAGVNSAANDTVLYAIWIKN